MKTMKKVKKTKKVKTIQISSRDWVFRKNPRLAGGYFSTRGAGGRGLIEVGTKWKDKDNQIDVLIHEILEATFTEDLKRYTDESGYRSSRDYIFVFDHDYLHGLGAKVGAALRSVGVIDESKL